MKRGYALFASVCGFQIASAWAYRPFEGTEADVAAPTEMEIELGTAYVHEPADDAWVVPAVVANYGLSRGREVILEGELVVPSAAPDSSHWAVEDTALSIKQVLRRGSLQEQEGLSIATECGVLLPTIHAERGFGGTCALIGSERWPAVTLHINGGVIRTREHDWTQSMNVMLEGPDKWRVRPVSELSFEWTATDDVHAALLGLIWETHQHVAVDAAFRYEATNNEHTWEIRAGFTWIP